MKVLWNIIRWFFGLIFCFGSIGGFAAGEFLGGSFTLILGLLLIPPVTKFLFRKKVEMQSASDLSQNGNDLMRKSLNSHSGNSFADKSFQLQNKGVQLLESIHIVGATKNIDTLIGRYDFILKMYDDFIDVSTSGRYLSDIQISIDRYKSMYYDRVINDYELKLIVQPNQNDMKDFFTKSLFKCFSQFYEQQCEEINRLKTDSAKQKRKENVLGVWNQTFSQYVISGSQNEKNQHQLNSLKELVDKLM